MDKEEQKGITPSEQKELRRVFDHLANYSKKRKLYATLNPLLDRRQKLEDVGEEMDMLDAKEEAVSREVDVVTAAGREAGVAMGHGEYVDSGSHGQNGGGDA